MDLDHKMYNTGLGIQKMRSLVFCNNIITEMSSPQL